MGPAGFWATWVVVLIASVDIIAVVSGVIASMDIPTEMMDGSVSVLSLCVLSVYVLPVGVLPLVCGSSVGEFNKSNGTGWTIAEFGTYGNSFTISYGGHWSPGTQAVPLYQKLSSLRQAHT